MNIKSSGIHHITIRVNDLDRSKRFYHDVLGFDVQTPTAELYYFPVGQTLIALRPPLKGTPSADRFSEYRIGVDHMAFAVADRSELEKVVKAVREAGYHTEGIEVDPTLGKDYVCFRDPDNV